MLYALKHTVEPYCREKLFEKRWLSTLSGVLQNRPMSCCFCSSAVLKPLRVDFEHFQLCRAPVVVSWKTKSHRFCHLKLWCVLMTCSISGFWSCIPVMFALLRLCVFCPWATPYWSTASVWLLIDWVIILPCSYNYIFFILPLIHRPVQVGFINEYWICLRLIYVCIELYPVFIFKLAPHSLFSTNPSSYFKWHLLVYPSHFANQSVLHPFCVLHICSTTYRSAEWSNSHMTFMLIKLSSIHAGSGDGGGKLHLCQDRKGLTIGWKWLFNMPLYSRRLLYSLRVSAVLNHTRNTSHAIT